MWGLGLLIPLLGAWSLQVTQDPDEVRVTEGDEVALGCRVLVAEPWDLLRLEWMKAEGSGALCATRVLPATPTPPNSCSPHTPRLRLAWDPPRATLSLNRVRGDDTGRYVCQVTLEIPHYATATGNGTLLNVTAAGADAGHQAGLPWGLPWGLAGALGGTALLVGLALLAHRGWRRNADEIIYHNVLPCSAWTPGNQLPSPRVMEKCLYQEAPRRARGPPTAPQP